MLTPQVASMWFTAVLVLFAIHVFYDMACDARVRARARRK